MIQSGTRPTSPLWLLLVLLAIWMIPLSRPVAVQAQDEPAVEEKANAAAAEPDKTASEGHKSQSTLMWLIETSGVIGAVILVISIYFVATVMQLFLELRASVVSPPELLEQCEQLLAKRDFNGIYKTAKESPLAVL